MNKIGSNMIVNFSLRLLMKVNKDLRVREGLKDSMIFGDIDSNDSSQNHRINNSGGFEAILQEK
jgi:hypothetical protein